MFHQWLFLTCWYDCLLITMWHTLHLGEYRRVIRGRDESTIFCLDHAKVAKSAIVHKEPDKGLRSKPRALELWSLEPDKGPCLSQPGYSLVSFFDTNVFGYSLGLFFIQIYIWIFVCIKFYIRHTLFWKQILMWHFSRKHEKSTFWIFTLGADAANSATLLMTVKDEKVKCTSHRRDPCHPAVSFEVLWIFQLPVPETRF